MSAVSNRLTPASKQTSISRLASAAWVEPHALKKSVAPPTCPVPKESAETLRPEPPSSRYSMALWMPNWAAGCRPRRLASHCVRPPEQLGRFPAKVAPPRKRCCVRRTGRVRRGGRDRGLLHCAAVPWLDLDLREAPCAEEHKDGREDGQHNEICELAVEGDAQKCGAQAVDSIR